MAADASCRRWPRPVLLVVLLLMLQLQWCRCADCRRFGATSAVLRAAKAAALLLGVLRCVAPWGLGGRHRCRTSACPPARCRHSKPFPPACLLPQASRAPASWPCG